MLKNHVTGKHEKQSAMCAELSVYLVTFSTSISNDSVHDLVMTYLNNATSLQEPVN